MSDVKWIKISTGIFDDEKIRYIEQLPEADSILTIWVKLLVLAGKKNLGGEIIFNDEMPYTDEMLATIFHRKVNTVRLALETFRKLRMIEIAEDRTIIICNWAKHQSAEGLEKIRQQNLERKRRQREKQLEQRNKRLLNRHDADACTALQTPDASRDGHATRHVTARDTVTQNSVPVTPVEKEDKNKKSSLPSLLSKERQPAELFRHDSEEELIRKLRAEAKDPADYVTNPDEAKRLICERILNGKDPSRPWSSSAMQNLVRLLPIPRIEIERIAWFRGLADDGTRALSARRPVTETGLTAFWSDEFTRANAFWQGVGRNHKSAQERKKDPPLWREFFRWKHCQDVILPATFWELDQDLREQYERDFQTFVKATGNAATDDK